MLVTSIVFLPLVGCLIAGLFQRWIGDKVAMAVSTSLLVVSAIFSAVTFADVAMNGPKETIELLRWFAIGGFEASWALRIDMLTAVMLVVVTSVSALVHIYSIGYMEEDPDRARFFSYLSLFTFAMLMLVTADNFIQLFFGWEGVGLASYLLIGFWYKKDTANAAAIKAFVVNRVGDFGFALGIMAVYFTFGTVEFDPVFAAIAANADVTAFGAAVATPVREAMVVFGGLEVRALELCAILLFIGAMGKSAQFFLHVWLPDAMEGPTPVSALIHAATMVTAGVFLVCRASAIFEYAPVSAMVVTVVGAVTALYAATVGLAQNDIKRVIAYSTCSQLGYMFFAAGVGAYNAAMFHLFTHAFFKALLFLGAGAVIHGLHHEQDMRNMGGLRKVMPWTWALMVIGTLALTGVGIPELKIGFAGFFSKDRIVEDAYIVGATGIDTAMLAFWLGVVAAALTSFYSWRLIFMTFHGQFRGDHHALAEAHDPPWVMRAPLVLLAIGAVLVGGVFYSSFIGKAQEGFWRGAIYTSDVNIPDSFHASHGKHEAAAGTGAVEGAHDSAQHDGADHSDDHASAELPRWVLWVTVGVTALGFLAAVWAYLLNQTLGRRIAARGGPIHSFLSNKWFFDEIYHFIFVRGARGLGDLFWKIGDRRIIDGVGPDGVAGAAMRAGKFASRRQTGFLYHYAFVMLLGVAAFAAYALVRSQGGAP